MTQVAAWSQAMATKPGPVIRVETIIRCSYEVETRHRYHRRCSRLAQEVIAGRGYCHPHARRVKP